MKKIKDKIKNLEKLLQFPSKLCESEYQIIFKRNNAFTWYFFEDPNEYFTFSFYIEHLIRGDGD